MLVGMDDNSRPTKTFNGSSHRMKSTTKSLDLTIGHALVTLVLWNVERPRIQESYLTLPDSGISVQTKLPQRWKPSERGEGKVMDPTLWAGKDTTGRHALLLSSNPGMWIFKEIKFR